jgi:DNA/RNA endonuclease YhcR with UshA esterase domain
MRGLLPLTATAVLIASPMVSQAHHSFAVYFDSSKDVTIKGKVTAFRFTNPHGIIVIDVVDAQGRVQEWRAETNAPVVLQRRGWTRESIKPGETITVEGWASRDGKPYVRLRSAVDANGRLIGTAPFGRQDQS